MLLVLSVDELDDANAAALADRDRFGACNEPAVDANVERRTGRFIERDDRAGSQAGRELGDVEASAAELDGHVERHVVKQCLEGLWVEVVFVVAHDCVPWPCTIEMIWTASTPRHTTGLAQALSTPAQYTGTRESMKVVRVWVDPRSRERILPSERRSVPSSTTTSMGTFASAFATAFAFALIAASAAGLGKRASGRA